jgi:hypothetical protein
MTSSESRRRRAAYTKGYQDGLAIQAKNARLRAAMKEACDLLAERIHGNAARSPGHNARVALEWAMKEGQTPPPQHISMGGKFGLGDRVRKTKGSSWQGRVVGFYSTELTPIGYAVESEREPGSVQIYPESALAALSGSEVEG